MTTDKPMGLRERKRRQTLQRITESALRLFAERGYEETTLEAVAEAADISQRGFFHYFASKEAILASWQSGMPDTLHAAIMAQPADLSPLEMLRGALSHVPDAFDQQQALVISRVIRESEQLRAGNSAKMIRLEQAAYGALVERFGDRQDQESLRMTAMVSVGAVRLALDAWSGGDGRIPLIDHIEQAFDALTTILPRS